jgi:predicted nuclease of predicted toxin-antitoxin system
MRLLVDANMPRQIAERLATLGHDAIDSRQVLPASAPDSDVASLARRECRIILTRDIGFGDPRSYPPALYPGIILFRMTEHARRDDVLALVEHVIGQLETTDLSGCLVVADDARKIRVRRTKPQP